MRDDCGRGSSITLAQTDSALGGVREGAESVGRPSAAWDVTAGVGRRQAPWAGQPATASFRALGDKHRRLEGSEPWRGPVPYSVF